MRVVLYIIAGFLLGYFFGIIGVAIGAAIGFFADSKACTCCK